jgi:hypothetical protein
MVAETLLMRPASPPVAMTFGPDPISAFMWLTMPPRGLKQAPWRWLGEEDELDKSAKDDGGHGGNHRPELAHLLSPLLRVPFKPLRPQRGLRLLREAPRCQ